MFQILGLNKWIIGLIAVGIIAALFSGFADTFDVGVKKMISYIPGVDFDLEIEYFRVYPEGGQLKYEIKYNNIPEYVFDEGHSDLSDILSVTINADYFQASHNDFIIEDAVSQIIANEQSSGTLRGTIQGDIGADDLTTVMDQIVGLKEPAVEFTLTFFFDGQRIIKEGPGFYIRPYIELHRGILNCRLINNYFPIRSKCIHGFIDAEDTAHIDWLLDHLNLPEFPTTISDRFCRTEYADISDENCRKNMHCLLDPSAGPGAPVSPGYEYYVNQQCNTYFIFNLLSKAHAALTDEDEPLPACDLENHVDGVSPSLQGDAGFETIIHVCEPSVQRLINSGYQKLDLCNEANNKPPECSRLEEGVDFNPEIESFEVLHVNGQLNYNIKYNNIPDYVLRGRGSDLLSVTIKAIYPHDNTHNYFIIEDAVSKIKEEGSSGTIAGVIEGKGRGSQAGTQLNAMAQIVHNKMPAVRFTLTSSFEGQQIVKESPSFYIQPYIRSYRGILNCRLVNYQNIIKNCYPEHTYASDLEVHKSWLLDHLNLPAFNSYDEADRFCGTVGNDCKKNIYCYLKPSISSTHSLFEPIVNGDEQCEYDVIFNLLSDLHTSLSDGTLPLCGDVRGFVEGVSPSGDFMTIGRLCEDSVKQLIDLVNSGSPELDLCDQTNQPPECNT